MDTRRKLSTSKRMLSLRTSLRFHHSQMLMERPRCLNSVCSAISVDTKRGTRTRTHSFLLFLNNAHIQIDFIYILRASGFIFLTHIQTRARTRAQLQTHTFSLFQLPTTNLFNVPNKKGSRPTNFSLGKLLA